MVNNKEDSDKRYFKLINDNSEDEQSNKKKIVDIYALEFTWIFIGEQGKRFITQLNEIENEKVFRINTVKWCIELLWSKFYVEIFNKIFLPYMAYLVLYIIFATYGSKVGYANKGDDDLTWYVI
jgi:hypothetical protein